MDGTTPEFILKAGTNIQKLRHSIGLVSTATTTNLMHKDFDYVHKLWNEKLQPYEDGYFDPYYDGLLYMFSLMHLSGKYQVITPAK
jgi:oligosaccharide reducing-end xylanase